MHIRGFTDAGVRRLAARVFTFFLAALLMVAGAAPAPAQTLLKLNNRKLTGSNGRPLKRLSSRFFGFWSPGPGPYWQGTNYLFGGLSQDPFYELVDPATRLRAGERGARVITLGINYDHLIFPGGVPTLNPAYEAPAWYAQERDVLRACYNGGVVRYKVLIFLPMFLDQSPQEDGLRATRILRAVDNFTRELGCPESLVVAAIYGCEPYGLVQQGKLTVDQYADHYLAVHAAIKADPAVAGVKVGAFLHFNDAKWNTPLFARCKSSIEAVAQDSFTWLGDLKVPSDYYKFTYTQYFEQDVIWHWDTLGGYRRFLVEAGCPGLPFFQTSSCFEHIDGTRFSFDEDDGVNTYNCGLKRNGQYVNASQAWAGLAGASHMLRWINPVKVDGAWYSGCTRFGHYNWPGVCGKMQPANQPWGMNVPPNSTAFVDYPEFLAPAFLAREISGLGWYKAPAVVNPPDPVFIDARNPAAPVAYPPIEAWALRGEAKGNKHKIVLINHTRKDVAMAVDPNGLPIAARAKLRSICGKRADGTTMPWNARNFWQCTGYYTGALVENIGYLPYVEDVSVASFTLPRHSVAVLTLTLTDPAYFDPDLTEAQEIAEEFDPTRF